MDASAVDGLAAYLVVWTGIEKGTSFGRACADGTLDDASACRRLVRQLVVTATDDAFVTMVTPDPSVRHYAFFVEVGDGLLSSVAWCVVMQRSCSNNFGCCLLAFAEAEQGRWLCVLRHCYVHWV